MERSRTWECRFPIKINERALKSLFDIQEVTHISSNNNGMEILNLSSIGDVIEKYEGENFTIHFRCALEIEDAAKILNAIGGQLSIELQKEQASQTALALFHLFYFYSY